MRVWGVDCDTKKITVVELVGGEYVDHWLLPDPKSQARKDWPERWNAIRRSVRQFLWAKASAGELPDIVYIEDVVYVRNIKVQTQLAWAAGTFAVYCMERACEPTFVDISTWKQQTVGRGNADKSQVKEWALRLLPGLQGGLLQDVYDAACLAFYAARNVGDLK